VIASQARRENFSRTCWITFHWRGMSSSVSVTSSPILRNVPPPQHGQAEGAGWLARTRFGVLKCVIPLFSVFVS
jgi:hypothetical protein